MNDDPMRVVTVPAGTRWDLRLQTDIDSGTARLDQPFDAATIFNYSRDGRVLIAAASQVKGFVGSLKASTQESRTGNLTLSFKDITIGERVTRLRASVEQLFNGLTGETATRVGTDAAIEAALGRLPGAGQPLLAGVFVGPGGSISSTEASDVKLAAGTVIRIRLDQPLQIGDVAPR
jgi:hypothetical protein